LTIINGRSAPGRLLGGGLEVLLGHALPQIGKMRFESCAGEVAFPPSAEAQKSYVHAPSLSFNSMLSVWNSFGHCLRVIVNETPLNLEKTTSSVLSVLLLIYALSLNKQKTIQMKLHILNVFKVLLLLLSLNTSLYKV